MCSLSAGLFKYEKTSRKYIFFLPDSVQCSMLIYESFANLHSIYMDFFGMFMNLRLFKHLIPLLSHAERVANAHFFYTLIVALFSTQHKRSVLHASSTLAIRQNGSFGFSSLLIFFK